ncbi:MAG: hypothetical protein ACQES9_07175 [Myxococcota bacterium]
MIKRTFFICLILSGLLNSACSDNDTEEVENIDLCGNNQLDSTEECDGDIFGGTTCLTAGYSGGYLKCSSRCEYDFSFCSGVLATCGNGTRDDYEECDQEDLRGLSCADFNLGEGQLGCNDNCRFDFSQCTKINNYCGDGFVTGDEECDTDNFEGKDCNTFGYYEGEIECGSDCQISLANCQKQCGDNLIQEEVGEECDGALSSGEDCSSLGYYGGELSCAEDCRYDLSDCQVYGKCGDGIVQESEGEECDGTQNLESSCFEFGYYGGTLECNSECKLDLSDCEETGKCGDSIVQTNYSEICDLANLNYESCISQGYYGGQLQCSSNCRAYIFSDCETYGRCGDGIVQTEYQEMCDGTNLNSFSCETLGYYGGELECGANCQEFSLSDCVFHGKCGDGILQEHYGEVCDLVTWEGHYCREIGYFGGEILCGGDCQDLDYTQCYNFASLGLSGTTESVSSINFDGDGSIKLAGNTMGSLYGNNNTNSNDIFQAGFSYDGSPSSTFQWYSNAVDIVHDQIVDASGVSYLVGRTASNYYGTDGILIKVAPSGALSWRKYLQTNQMDLAKAITLSRDGSHLYVAGNTKGDFNNPDAPVSNYTDIFLAKIEVATANLVWVQQYGIFDSNEKAVSVFADDDGFIYVLGNTEDSMGDSNLCADNFFMKSFHENGLSISSYVYGTPYYRGCCNDYIRSAVYDREENVFLIAGDTGGEFISTNQGGSDLIAAKINVATGAIFSRTQWGTSEDEKAEGIVQIGDEIYITGYTEGDMGSINNGGKDLFVTHFLPPDNSGISLYNPFQVDWHEQWGSAQDDQGKDIAVYENTVCVAADSNGDLFGLDANSSGNVFIYCFPHGP